MTKDEDIDRTVFESFLLIVRDPERHGELWALATEREREFDEVKGAVERLLGDRSDASIEAEIDHRFEDHWRTSGDGPIYVEFRGTWMSEDDALDAENEDP